MKFRRMLVSAMFAMTLLGALPAFARGVTIDFMSGANSTVKGVYVTKEFWFELSEDWEFPEAATLDLRFSHTPILVRQLSTLSVQVNGSPIESIYLDNGNLRNAQLVVQIPGRLLKGGMNVLTLVVKMRSDLKDLCDDVHNPALWTLLEKESRLQVPYVEKEVVPDLAKFPSDYANPDLLYTKDKEKIHAVIVVPTAPTAAEMDLVGALAVVLGQDVGLGAGGFRVVAADKADPADLKSRQIIVAGGLDFVKRLTGSPWRIPVPMDTVAGEPGGALMEFKSPFNPYRRLLVATGRDDAALKLVSDHLKTPATVRNLKGPSVTFDKPPVFEAANDGRQDAAFMVRLQDLKMSDLQARGKFYHSITFTMPNPYVGKVKDGAFLRVSMSHSELLLPQSSSLLVKVNGEPVRSLRLTKDTASRNTWDIKIPLQYLNTRFLTFELELFLDIGDPDCYYNHPEMAWFTLHNDTLLYLPVDSASDETLANYPYMFLRWNRFDKLGVVVVDPVSEGSLSAAFNIVAYLSQSLRSPNWVDLLFTTGKQLTQVQRNSLNLLVVGPLGAMLPDPQWSATLPKELSGREIQGRGDILNTAGFLSLMRMPDGGRRVLAVTGRSDEEISLAAPHLYAPGKVEWVRGTLAAAISDDELKVLLPPTMADPVAQFDPAKVRFEEKDGKMVPVLEVPQPAPAPSRYNMAYLVFFILTPVLVLLVVLRLRALAREGRDKA